MQGAYAHARVFDHAGRTDTRDACPSVLPSGWITPSAPGLKVLSRLNGWPMRSPADASLLSSRARRTARGHVVRYSFMQWTLHHLLLAGLPAHIGFVLYSSCGTRNEAP